MPTQMPALPEGRDRFAHPDVMFTAEQMHAYAREYAASLTASEGAAQVPEADDFLHGICVALQVVTAMDCGVTWAEIVRAAGVDDMLHYATFVEPDEWRLAGFDKYAEGELRRRRPRTPREGSLPDRANPAGVSAEGIEPGPKDAPKGECATPQAGAAPVEERAAFVKWKTAASIPGYSENHAWEAWKARGAAPSAERVTAEPVAPNWPKLMPAYGEVKWSDLKAAIAEAIGAPWTGDPSYYIGHQRAPINMNSLNRIVSAFVALATPPAAAPVGEAPRLLDEAMTRMDRARNCLTGGNPRPACNWGMLDTSDLRAALTHSKPAEPPACCNAQCQTPTTCSSSGSCLESYIQRRLAHQSAVPPHVRLAVEATRADLGPDDGATNYPDVRYLLAFVESLVKPSLVKP